MQQPTANSFPKAEHLKSRKRIDLLFAKGRSFFVHPVKVFWQLEPKSTGILPGELATAGNLQAGVSASKRNFKKAVHRNRVKRLLREAYRLNKQELQAVMKSRPESLAVFFIYVDKTLPNFALVEDKMKLCLAKLQKLVEEGS